METNFLTNIQSFLITIQRGVKVIPHSFSKLGVPPNSVLFGGTVPPNSVLFGRTVLPNSVFFGGTVPPNSFPLFFTRILGALRPPRNSSPSGRPARYAHMYSRFAQIFVDTQKTDTLAF